MTTRETLCGRDVCIAINGRQLLQAESAQLWQSAEVHRVRTCFFNGDVAHLEGKTEYKLNLVGVRFRRPFENCNFYDLDQFSVELVMDGLKMTLGGCRWDDFRAVADPDKFREHISIVALTMNTEEQNEGNG